MTDTNSQPPSQDSIKPDAPDTIHRQKRGPSSSHVDPAGNRDAEKLLKEGERLAAEKTKANTGS